MRNSNLGGSNSLNASTRPAGRRARLLAAATTAAAALIASAVAPAAHAQEAFSLNADGNAGNSPNPAVYRWPLPIWTGPAGEYPGKDDVNDLATINFREFNNTDPAGDAQVQIDLAFPEFFDPVTGPTAGDDFNQSGVYALDVLTLTESGTGNTDGTFTNSATDGGNAVLRLNKIDYTSGGRTINFASNVRVDAAGSLLTLNATANTLNFQGPVTGALTTDLLVNATGGAVRFNWLKVDLENNFSGLRLAGTNAVVFENIPGGGDFDISKVSFEGTTRIDIDRDTTNLAQKYAVNVIGTSTVAAGARIRARFNDDSGSVATGGVLRLNGNVTINGAAEIGTENASGTIEVGNPDEYANNATATRLIQAAADAPLTLAPHGYAVNDVGVISINTVAQGRTAETNVINGGQVFLRRRDGVGSGQINVGPTSVANSVGSTLIFENTAAGSGTPIEVFVAPYAAIGGNVSGATFVNGTDPADNQIAIGPAGEGNRIFVEGLSPAPTTAVAGVNANYLGIATSADYTLSDRTGIYKGFALGEALMSSAADYTGDIADTSGNALEIFMSGYRKLRPLGSAAGNTTPSFNTVTTGPDAGKVFVNGPGDLYLQAFAVSAGVNGNPAVDGNWGTIVRTGMLNNPLAPLANTQNADIITFDDTGALVAGKTLDARQGRVRVLDADAFQGTANINAGATLFLDRELTRGTYNINAGAAGEHPGAVYMNGGYRLNGASGATYAFQPGTLLVLDNDMNTTTVGLPENVDIVLDDENADAFTGKGLVLGQGRRLGTTTNRSVDLTGGTGVAAAAGATAVSLSASNGDVFTFNDPVQLSGAAVTVNPTAAFVTTTTGANMTRTSEVQNGNVRFNGTVRAASMTIETGTVTFNGADTNILGDLRIAATVVSQGPGAVYFGAGGPQTDGNANLTSRFISTTGNAADRVAGNIIIGAGNRVEVGLKFDAPTVNGRVDVTQPFLIEGALPADDRRFWISRRLAAAGAPVMPVTLSNVTLADGAGFGIDEDNTDVRASVTMLGAANTGINDQFDFVNITRSATLPAFNGTNPTVLSNGRVGDTTATPSIYGTIGAGVQVDNIKGQVFFEAGSALNGLVRTQATPAGGDSFVTFDGVENTVDPTLSTGGVIGGTGTVQLGNNGVVTTGEDARIRVPDLPAGSPLVVTVLPTIQVVNDGNNANVDGQIQVQRNIGTDLAISGAGVYRSIVIDPGAIGVLSVADGTTIHARNLTVGRLGTLTATAFSTDQRLDTLAGGGTVALTAGRNLIVGRNNNGVATGLAADSDHIAPGDAGDPVNRIGTLTIATGGLTLEDGFTLDYDATSPSTADLVNLTGSGAAFAIPTGLASLASVVTTNPGGTTTFNPSDKYVLFAWPSATDPIAAADGPLNGWTVTGDILGQVVYEASTNRIVLTNLTAVPEPTAALGLAAAAGIASLGRRRRRTC